MESQDKLFTSSISWHTLYEGRGLIPTSRSPDYHREKRRKKECIANRVDLDKKNENRRGNICGWFFKIASHLGFSVQ